MSRYVDVLCPNCQATFDAPSSMKGGLANCPECGKAVTVGGGPEPLFWLLLGGGFLFVLLVSGGLFAAAGWVPALVVFLVGVGIISLILALS